MGMFTNRTVESSTMLLQFIQQSMQFGVVLLAAYYCYTRVQVGTLGEQVEQKCIPFLQIMDNYTS